MAVPANPTLQEFVGSSWLLRTLLLVQHQDPDQIQKIPPLSVTCM